MTILIIKISTVNQGFLFTTRIQQHSLFSLKRGIKKIKLSNLNFKKLKGLENNYLKSRTKLNFLAFILKPPPIFSIFSTMSINFVKKNLKKFSLIKMLNLIVQCIYILLKSTMICEYVNNIVLQNHYNF